MTHNDPGTSEGLAHAPATRRRSRRLVLAVGGVAVACLLSAGMLVGMMRPALPAAASGQLSAEDYRATLEIMDTISSSVSAAVKGNAAEVARHIDTTSLVSAAVTDVYSDPRVRQPLIGYTAMHPGVTQEQITARTIALANEELWEHIRNGSLPRRIPLPGGTLKGLVASAYARQSVDSIIVDAGGATISAALPYKGQRFRVKVRVVRAAGIWKVTRIENLVDLAKQAGY
jgi:hypothetical protein